MPAAQPIVRRTEIQSGIHAIGVSTADVLMVHSSLSALGWVEGGADAVIDALLDAVAPEGTVVMPTFTWDTYHDAHGVAFDVGQTPSETGRISETFRRRPNALRSTHICHSVTAVGPMASHLLGDGVHSFGIGSTFDRLYMANAWIVLLGVDFSVCTALHMVERFADVPYRHYRDYARSRVVQADGKTVPSRSLEYLREPGYSNDFAKMGRILAKDGVTRTARIGHGIVTVVRIRDLFTHTMQRMRQDIGFLLSEDSKKPMQ